MTDSLSKKSLLPEDAKRLFFENEERRPLSGRSERSIIRPPYRPISDAKWPFWPSRRGAETMNMPCFLGESPNRNLRRPRRRATLSALMDIGPGGARQTDLRRVFDSEPIRDLPLPLGEGRGEGVFWGEGVLMRRFSLTLTLSQRERGFESVGPSGRSPSRLAPQPS
jgi:hypothetical protein